MQCQTFSSSWALLFNRQAGTASLSPWPLHFSLFHLPDLFAISLLNCQGRAGLHKADQAVLQYCIFFQHVFWLFTEHWPEDAEYTLRAKVWNYSVITCVHSESIMRSVEQQQKQAEASPSLWGFNSYKIKVLAVEEMNLNTASLLLPCIITVIHPSKHSPLAYTHS